MDEDTVSKPAIKNSTACAVRSSSVHTIKGHGQLGVGK